VSGADATAASSDGAVELFEVRLVDLPLVLRERSRQHGADLLREMALIQVSRQAGTATDVPGRLLELAAELDRSYAPYIAASTEQMEAALDRGEHTLPEVVYRLPSSSVDFVRHLAAVLDEVEQ
jgi:hypothetical protein